MDFSISSGNTGGCLLTCYFVSDLHGRIDRYRKLFARVRIEPPDALFMGGDLLPHTSRARLASGNGPDGFAGGYLAAEFRALRNALRNSYPRVFLILGNDDPRSVEDVFAQEAGRDLWEYLHNRKVRWQGYSVYGYACVPPTPFQLKDWERYDVSRYVDPGCIPPEKGFCSVSVTDRERRLATIQRDLAQLTGGDDLSQAIFLFHTPPYQTNLDRTAVDGMKVDHVPLDVHAGSIAVRRFIESRQPLVTLHGHIHESARITGSWKEMIGRTPAFSAAHDGPELALVKFSPQDPAKAGRELI
jgi:Icc-related predicted phosphoesterase